jgi:hypothetical protein
VSDHRLRDLERRWQASGSHPDAVALLRERLRTGELSRDRVQLAAYAGDAAACDAVGEGAGPSSLDDWVVGLGRWGGPGLVRAAIGAIRPLVPPPPGQRRGLSEVQRLDAPLRAAEAWLRCPCEEHARRAELESRMVQFEHGSYRSTSRDDAFSDDQRALLRLVADAVREVAAIPAAANATLQAARALREAAIVAAFSETESPGDDAPRDEVTVLAHARAALVTWALGRSAE